jgi:ribosomal protein L32
MYLCINYSLLTYDSRVGVTPWYRPRLRPASTPWRSQRSQMHVPWDDSAVKLFTHTTHPTNQTATWARRPILVRHLSHLLSGTSLRAAKDHWTFTIFYLSAAEHRSWAIEPKRRCQPALQCSSGSRCRLCGHQTSPNHLKFCWVVHPKV